MPVSLPCQLSGGELVIDGGERLSVGGVSVVERLFMSLLNITDSFCKLSLMLCGQLGSL